MYYHHHRQWHHHLHDHRRHCDHRRYRNHRHYCYHCCRYLMLPITIDVVLFFFLVKL